MVGIASYVTYNPPISATFFTYYLLYPGDLIELQQCTSATAIELPLIVDPVSFINRESSLKISKLIAKGKIAETATTAFRHIWRK